MALILVVEDERLLRWSIEQRLIRSGHTVHAVANLAQAGEHLEIHRPALMLLDLSLPDGHGLDFYERERDRLEDTIVLVMTAVGQVDDAVRAMKLGAADFLSKPVDHDSLVALVERSLEMRSRDLEAAAARVDRERQLGVDIVAYSPAFRRALEVACGVARSGVASVLIQG